jgi:hypothetical protein
VRVVAATPDDVPWIVERAHCAPTSRFMAIKAVDNAGVIRGMVGYDSWSRNSCEAHVAVESPIAWRSLVVPTFHYPFEQMGLGVLLALIPAWNARSQQLVKRLGFRETYRIRDGFEIGVDNVLFEMRRDECRWLPQQVREAA